MARRSNASNFSLKETKKSSKLAMENIYFIFIIIIIISMQFIDFFFFFFFLFSSSKSRTVVVENLPEDYSRQNLEKIFSVAGW